MTPSFSYWGSEPTVAPFAGLIGIASCCVCDVLVLCCMCEFECVFVLLVSCLSCLWPVPKWPNRPSENNVEDVSWPLLRSSHSLPSREPFWSFLEVCASRNLLICAAPNLISKSTALGTITYHDQNITTTGMITITNVRDNNKEARQRNIILFAG